MCDAHTDNLAYEIKTNDLYKIFYKDKGKFGFSHYLDESKFYG